MTASWAFALVCGALGVLVPWLIRQLPEPDSRAAQNYSGPSLQAVGSGRWLWLATALSAASVGGLLGAQLGWIPDLGWLAAVVPGGVALAWLDHRTRLLPRRLVFGLYAIVLIGMAAAALDAGSWVAVTRAALGWLALGGWYFLFWRLGGLVGYGDVRLAGLLGLVLGHVGGGRDSQPAPVASRPIVAGSQDPIWARHAHRSSGRFGLRQPDVGLRSTSDGRSERGGAAWETVRHASLVDRR